ncbi:hypothetical protein Hanom_Chr15g01370411 [Helianthus anomalus]
MRVSVFPKVVRSSALFLIQLSKLESSRAGTFTVDLQYADVSELKASPKISSHTIRFGQYIHFFNIIGPFQATKGDRAKVKVKAVIW